MTKEFCTDDGCGKCAITGVPGVLDDCHVTIEFGYGSDKDLTTYNFGPVSDETGKQILEYIQSLMPAHKNVEQHARDVTDEIFK